LLGDLLRSRGDDEHAIAAGKRQFRLLPGRGLVGAEAEHDAARVDVEGVGLAGGPGHVERDRRRRQLLEPGAYLVDGGDGEADGEAGKAVDGSRRPVLLPRAAETRQVVRATGL